MSTDLIAFLAWLTVVVTVVVIYRRSHRNWPPDPNPPHPQQNPSDPDEEASP